jgi:hypothetical protein
MSDGTVLTEEASANVATSLEAINTGHTYEYAGTVYSLYICSNPELFLHSKESTRLAKQRKDLML